MSDKIRVQVTATQEITYDQVVEMTPEEWAEVEEAMDADDYAALGAMGEQWIDTTDVCDAREVEDVWFHKLKPPPEPKP